MSLSMTFYLAGCICPPGGYQSGMYRPGYTPYHACFEGACDPCGPVETGCNGGCGDVGCSGIEYGCNPCAPASCMSCMPRMTDCRSSFANLGNGVFLIGRGILDVAGAPLVAIGSVLSSGCRYEVLSICPEVSYVGSCYTTSEPCSPAACSPGCESCANGYTEGMRYNTSAKNWAASIPPPPRLGSSVIQASYQEPTAPAAKFVQPMK